MEEIHLAGDFINILNVVFPGLLVVSVSVSFLLEDTAVFPVILRNHRLHLKQLKKHLINSL